MFQPVTVAISQAKQKKNPLLSTGLAKLIAFWDIDLSSAFCPEPVINLTVVIDFSGTLVPGESFQKLHLAVGAPSN